MEVVVIKMVIVFSCLAVLMLLIDKDHLLNDDYDEGIIPEPISDKVTALNGWMVVLINFFVISTSLLCIWE